MNITQKRITLACYYNIATSMSPTVLCRLLDLESVQANHLILTHGPSESDLSALIVARGLCAKVLRTALGLQEIKGPLRVTMMRDCLSLDLGQGPHVPEALRKVVRILADLEALLGANVQILPQGRAMWRLVYQGRVVGFAGTYLNACIRANELETTLLKAA